MSMMALSPIWLPLNYGDIVEVGIAIALCFKLRLDIIIEEPEISVNNALESSLFCRFDFVYIGF